MLASLRSRVGGGWTNSPAPKNQPFGGKCRLASVDFDVQLGGKMRPACGGEGALESRSLGSGVKEHSFMPDECEPEGREVI
ncbi:MAG TPA: hypothetical protein VGN42_18050 [Pirellulales bacterium]|jgi:hypothetical protein|nr:hypothetical protein [Pirellulales bacterium]